MNTLELMQVLLLWAECGDRSSLEATVFRSPMYASTMDDALTDFYIVLFNDHLRICKYMNWMSWLMLELRCGRSFQRDFLLLSFSISDIPKYDLLGPFYDV